MQNREETGKRFSAKRILAFICVIALCLSLIPSREFLAAYATNAEEPGTSAEPEGGVPSNPEDKANGQPSDTGGAENGQPKMEPVVTACSVKVTVKNDGNPVKDAVVEVGEKTASTRDDGTATITGLPADEYTVKVSATGYDSATESVTVAEGDTEKTVDINLTRCKCTITTSASAGCSINAPTEVTYGESAEATITVNTGYDLTSIKVNGEDVTTRVSDDGKLTLSNITENKQIVVTCTKQSFTVTATVGSNGSLNGKSEGGDVKVDYEDDYSYTAKANKGYHVAVVKVDGAEVLSNGQDSQNEYQGKIEKVTSTHKIEVTFAPNTYEFTVKLDRNTASGTAEIKNGSSSVASGDKLSVVYDSSVNLTVTPKEGYQASVAVFTAGGDKIKEITPSGNTYSISDVAENAEVRVTVEAIEYKITGYNGLGANVTDTFTVEDSRSEVSLADPSPVTGYTFVGWFEAKDGKVDAASTKVTSVPSNVPGDVELYAVWEINSISAVADGTVKGEVITGKESDWGWFDGEEVEIKLSSEADGISYYYQLNGNDTLVSVDGSSIKVAKAVNHSTSSYSITASRVEKVNGVECTYALNDPIAFVVKQDGAVPVLTVKQTKTWDNASNHTAMGRTNKEKDAFTIFAADDGSGIAKVEYQYVKFSSVSTKNEAALITYLDEETWNDVAAEAVTDKVLEFTEPGEWVLIVRATDKAGNVHYVDSDGGLFDNTPPVIGVSFDTEAKANGNIYSDSSVTATITVTDDTLVYSTDESYNGYTITVNGSPVTPDEGTVSLKKDNGMVWTAAYTFGADTYNNKGKQILSVEAVDKTGNPAEKYTSKEICIDKEGPQIDVNYSYTNGKATKDAQKADKVYSDGDIIAAITVKDAFLVDSLNDKYNSYTVQINGVDKTVTEPALVYEDGTYVWTAKVTLTADEYAGKGEQKLTVSAKDEAGTLSKYGTPSKYESNKLYIDTTTPVITVAYQYALVGKQKTMDASAVENDFTYSSDKITATITVEDAGLDANADGVAPVIKVDGNEVQCTASEWSNGAAKWVATYTLEEENKSTIMTVDVADECGNTKSYKSGNLLIDTTAAKVTSATLKVEGNKILNFLTFGNFFNTKATLTVNFSDVVGEEDGSGVVDIALLKDGEAYQNQTVAHLNSGSVEFTIPEEDIDQILEGEISVVTTDCVGNHDAFELENVCQDANSSYILYETTAPTNQTNYQDNTVSYQDQNGNYWILDGQSVTISVKDEKSGLNTVTVQNNGVSAKSTADQPEDQISEDGTFSYEKLDNKTTEVTYTIAYGDLNNGKNIITVNAQDNCGNDMEELVFEVYKDAAPAKVTSLEVGADDWDNTYNALKFGAYKNTDVTVTIGIADGTEDEAYSSGIKSAVLIYNNDQKTMDVASNDALLRNVNKTTATVTIPVTGDVQRSDLQIVLTDNVGNTITYGNLKDFGDTNLQVNSLMLETIKPAKEKIVITPMKETYKATDGKLWYDSKDVQFTVKANDPDSGIRSIALKLNEQDVDTWNYYSEQKQTTDKTVNFKLSDYSAVREGTNTLVVTVTDNAGNVNENGRTVYIDLTAPAITKATLEKQNDSAVAGVLRFLTFGNFFNVQTKLTVYYDDTVSGISPVVGGKEISLFLDGKTEAYQSKTVDAVEDKGSVAFTIPEDKLDKTLTGLLTMNVTDAVGNAANKVNFNSVGQNGSEKVQSSSIMYEVNKPTSSSNYQDKSVSYKDQNGNCWILDQQNVIITIFDYESGLNTVTVQNNGVFAKSTADQPEDQLDDDGTYRYGELDEKTTKVTYTIAYADLNEGENLITVNAQDNSGNQMDELKFKVYKDTGKAIIAALNLSGNGWDDEYNALKFGSYFNDDVTVTVDAMDGIVEKCSSGFAKVELIYNGEMYRMKLNSTDASINESVTSNSVYTLKLPEVPTEGDIQIILTDNVGNTATYGRNGDGKSNTKDFGTTNLKNGVNALMMEKVDPKVNSVVPMQETYRDGKGNLWYNTKDVEYSVVVSDADSGIRNVSAKLNGEDVDFWDYHENAEKTRKETLTFKLGDYKAVKEGKNTLTISVTDNAGNTTTSKESVVYIDLTNPTVVGFRFNLDKYPEAYRDLATEFGAYDDIADVVEVTTYGFYFKQGVNVTVNVGDSAKTSGSSSGIKQITYKAVDISGKTVVSGTLNKVKVDANVNGFTTTSGTFKIPANFKGQIYAFAEDNVTNFPSTMQDGNTVPHYVEPNDTIVENAKQHEASSDIEFTTPTANYRTADGQDLYSGNINVTFKVTDTYSGIRSIDWTVTSPDDAGNNQSGTVNVSNKGALSGDTSNWKKVQSEKNLVTVMQNTINVSNNSNDIVVKVTLTDRAGNTSSKEIKFSIDKTAPTIEVVYDNNTPDPAYNDFYNRDRTATITITERNFDENGVNLSITNTLGATPGISGWTRHAATDHANDRDTYTTTITFHDDGDYTFDIGFTDLAGNSATSYSDHFSIDETAPVVSGITITNAGGVNVGQDEYSASDVTVSITIIERNFDAGRITCTMTRDGASYPVALNWGKNGDTNTTSVTVSGDARYTFDLSGSDMAGNNAEQVPQRTFFVDETAPEIIFADVVDGAPYAGEIIPKVSFSDKYYAGYTTTLERTVRNQKNVNVTADFVKPFSENAQGGNGQIDNLESIEENDGIYTWTVTVADRAGNETSLPITYSVNRFGSVYVYSDDLIAAMEGYHQTVNGDLHITAYNATRLIKADLNIVRDGSSVSDTTPDLNPEKETGESGWFEYVFPIDNNELRTDGRYEISLTDNDAAKNTRTNSDEPIWFYVDTTAPVFDSVIGLEESAVNADELTVKFSTSDAIALSQVTAYVNDTPVSTADDFENQQNYEGSFVVNEGLRQAVRLVAVDKAGNVIDTAEETFNPGYTFNREVTVSTNPFVRWYSHTALFWGTIGSAVVVVASSLFIFLLGKRRKKEEKEQEVGARKK